MTRLEGKVALVTGGSSGIGLAAALAFAHEGARVVIASRGVESGEAAARQVRELGGEAVHVTVDVADAEQVAALVSRCVVLFGRLDCAFNNAATGGPGDLCADIPEADFDRTIAVNLKGVWLCMKHEIAQMLRQGGGTIVNMSSVDGLTGSPYAAAYAASKHGVNGLTRSAAIEYGPAGIRVNAICGGGFSTETLARGYGHDLAWVERYRRPAIPLARLGRPEECAEVAVWLCSDASSYATGLCIPVDGGLLADSASYQALRRGEATFEGESIEWPHR
jgi:NAD(P)-dependent dehydrogenase (short-subunit alcohol dehydrogenase family)